MIVTGRAPFGAFHRGRWTVQLVGGLWRLAYKQFKIEAVKEAVRLI
jgi:hypothetical protein